MLEHQGGFDPTGQEITGGGNDVKLPTLTEIILLPEEPGGLHYMGSGGRY